MDSSQGPTSESYFSGVYKPSESPKGSSGAIWMIPTTPPPPSKHSGLRLPVTARDSQSYNWIMSGGFPRIPHPGLGVNPRVVANFTGCQGKNKLLAINYSIYLRWFEKVKHIFSQMVVKRLVMNPMVPSVKEIT